MKIFQFVLYGLFLISCSNTPKSNSANNSDSKMTDKKDTIAWIKYNSGSQCSKEEALNLVVTNQEELNSLWAKAFSNDMPPEKPTVDFSEKTVVALFLGMVNSGGHAIEISSLHRDTTGDIIVEATHTSPGKNCMSTMAIEFPYFIAIIDAKLNAKTKFSVTEKKVDCE